MSKNNKVNLKISTKDEDKRLEDEILMEMITNPSKYVSNPNPTKPLVPFIKNHSTDDKNELDDILDQVGHLKNKSLTKVVSRARLATNPWGD